MVRYPKIFSIGDSHSANFHPMAHTFNMGAELMHSVNIDGNLKYLLNHGDIAIHHGLWIFSNGEIDARCHIYRQVTEKGRDEDEVINTLVTKYVNKIAEVKHTLNNSVSISSVIPPVAIEGIDRIETSTHFPILGADTDRRRYVIKLNTLLRHLCKQHDIGYIDIYSLYAVDGFLPKEFADADYVHLYNRDRVLVMMDNTEEFQQYRG